MTDEFDLARDLCQTAQGLDLNEADTRHQIIDPLLHGVFGWPRNRTSCERQVHTGYADYILHRPDGGIMLIIEAKREGAYFELPDAMSGKSPAFYAQMRILLTSPAIKASVAQVRAYALEVGSDIAAITNGNVWIFFRTFQKDKDWRTLKAFVVKSLDYFHDSFVEALNHFSFDAVMERGSLRLLLLDSDFQNRSLYYPRQRMQQMTYDSPVDANKYASQFRPIVERFFGKINVGDDDLMENCYVTGREYEIAFANAKNRLEERVTPYLEQYGVKSFTASDSGGGFGSRLSKSLTTDRGGDVVVLFGGKGVGKSTFLNRLLFNKAPQIIKKNAVVAVIDLLDCADTEEAIYKTIWSELVTKIDAENLLSEDRKALESLFADRFERAQKQDLYGLQPDTESYNTRINDLIASWRQDMPYVAERLAALWRSRHKAIIAVIDNTDQMTAAHQELCFTIAQEISKRLTCLAVISMREERFQASSIHGVLDAYQNSGFQISAPAPRQVFQRRIAYVQQLVASHSEDQNFNLPYRIDKDVIQAFFGLLWREFSNPHSHLANFLEACSHGNIRFALELFRGFVVSGYTNVSEMTANGNWTVQIHQVIKPFLIPSRFFYAEDLSRIPNLFQIRSKIHGSHFTALRILEKLNIGEDRSSSPFVPLAQLSPHFSDVFEMQDDFEQNLDVLLKHGLIEASNRLDKFDSQLDSVRITSYGAYMRASLCLTFTYLDLISVDCAISHQQVANFITESCTNEYRRFGQNDKWGRIQSRLTKTDEFVRYLEAEESREMNLFKTHEYPRITAALRERFDNERLQVLKSAKRNT